MAQHTQAGWSGSGSGHSPDHFGRESELGNLTITPACYPSQPLSFGQNMDNAYDWMSPPAGMDSFYPAPPLNNHLNEGLWGDCPSVTSLQYPQSPLSTTGVPENRVSSNGLNPAPPSGNSNNHSSDLLISKSAQAAPDSPDIPTAMTPIHPFNPKRLANPSNKRPGSFPSTRSTQATEDLAAPRDPISLIFDAINLLNAAVDQSQSPSDCGFKEVALHTKLLKNAAFRCLESQKKRDAQKRQTASSLLTPPTSRSIASTIPNNSSSSNHDLASTLPFGPTQRYFNEHGLNRIPETIRQEPSRKGSITASHSPKRRRKPGSSEDSISNSVSGPQLKRMRLPAVRESVKTGADSQDRRFPCQSCRKCFTVLPRWKDHQSRTHLPTRVYVCRFCFGEKRRKSGPSTKCRKKDNLRTHLRHAHNYNNDNERDEMMLNEEIERGIIEITGVYHDKCGYCQLKLPDAESSRRHIIDHMNDGETWNWEHQCEQDHELEIRKCVAAQLGSPEVEKDNPGESDDDQEYSDGDGEHPGRTDFDRDGEPPGGSDLDGDAEFASPSGRGSEGGSFSGNGGGRSALTGFSVNANSAGGCHVGPRGEDSFAGEIDMPLESKDVETTSSVLVPFQSLTVVRKLGSGGFGNVQKVFCNDSKQTLAMKTIQRKRFGSSHAQVTAAFENEVRVMRALRALRNPHLVEFICSYTHDDQYSILMAPSAHMDLARYMRTAESTPDSRKNLVRGINCLAATIKEMHSESGVHVSVAHHDLKPANILLHASGRFVLADFGLSRFYKGNSEFTRATKVTPEYAPPEAIEQGWQNRASDVFTLGCVFTEILTWILGKSLSEFEGYRSTPAGDKSFYKTREKTKEWIDLLEEQERMRCPDRTCSVPFDIIRQMISKNPKDRPTAYEVWLKFPKCTCRSDLRKSSHKDSNSNREFKEWLRSDRDWKGRDKSGQCANRSTAPSSFPQVTSSDHLSSTSLRKSESPATTEPYICSKDTTSADANREDSTASDQSKGLKLLLAPRDTNTEYIPLVDIVAVHGFSSYDTLDRQESNWFKDFLPKDLPTKARVFTWGYGSSLHPSLDGVNSGITESASDLLKRVARMRWDCPNRPLIFIGHSLGGLVIKQALNLAKNDRNYSEVYSATRGVICVDADYEIAFHGSMEEVIARLAPNRQSHNDDQDPQQPPGAIVVRVGPNAKSISIRAPSESEAGPPQSEPRSPPKSSEIDGKSGENTGLNNIDQSAPGKPELQAPGLAKTTILGPTVRKNPAKPEHHDICKAIVAEWWHRLCEEAMTTETWRASGAPPQERCTFLVAAH